MKRQVKSLQDYSYVKILKLWVSIGVGFAIIYYLLNLFFPQHGLIYTHNALNHELADFITILYFSFITLTTTGYGDVIPLGISKILSLLEIFSGVIVFGFLISKLISTRQGKIIEELYDISFEDKINRLKSGLYVYRANISRIIDRIKAERRIKHYDITDLEANLEGVKININRVSDFLISEEKKPATKLNDLNINLLFNSISLTTSRVIGILNILKSKRSHFEQKTILLYISDSVRSIRKLQKVYQGRIFKEEVKSTLNTIDKSLKTIEDLME